MASKKIDDEAAAIADGKGKQLGLPDGVLAALVAEDDVDFTPKEIATLRDKHGIDPSLSKRNEVEAAGLLLKDNLTANKGDVDLAVAEYRGGKDRASWDKDTSAFVSKVNRRSASGLRMGDAAAAPPTMAPAGRRSASGMSGLPAAPAPFSMGSGAPAAPSPLVPTGMEDASAQMSMGDPAAGLPAAAVLGAGTAPLPPMAAQAAAPAPAPEAPAPAAAPAPTGPPAVGPKTLAAYRDGTLSPERRAEIDRAVKAGTMVMPDGQPAGERAPDTRSGLSQAADALGQLPGRIGEAITGNERRTAETEAADDFYGAPEFSDFAVLKYNNEKAIAAQKARDDAGIPRPTFLQQVQDSFKDFSLTDALMEQFGPSKSKQLIANSMFAAPEELIKIMQAKFPDVKSRKDDKGNWFVTSPIDGKERAVKPGIRWTDAPRVAGSLLAGAVVIGTGGAAGGGLAGALAGGVGGAVASQTAIEGMQAASGGEFNPGEIAMAAAGGALPAVGGLVGRAVGKGARAVGNAGLDAIAPAVKAGAAEVADDAARAVGAVDGASSAAVTAVEDTTRASVSRAADVAPALDDVTRASVPKATLEAPSLSQAADAPAAAAVADAAAPVAAKAPNEAIKAVLNEAGDVDFGKLATLSREATRDGVKGAAAKRTLAQAIEINPEAVESAARLGIDLPADVLGDSVQLQKSIGQLRAQAGSEAEKRFASSMDAAVRKADDVVAEIGGASSAGDISDRVLASLDSARADLKGQASKLYDDVDAVVKKPAPVSLDNLEKLLIERKAELGGVLKGPEAELERLVARAKVSPNIPTKDGIQRATYGALAEEKALVGRALSRLESMYGSMDERVLKRLYGAMAEDQLANVKRIGGEAAADKVRLANKLTSNQKALEEKIVGAFGKEGKGSIASLMEGAIKDAGKGNVKRLNQLLDVVPDEMRGDVLTTALSSLSRAKGGVSKGGFGFAEFADVYRGLRLSGNEGVYKAFVEGVGPKRAEVFRDLFELSKRITKARASVPTTGKANQPLLQALATENLVGKIINSGLGANVVRGAGAGLGAVGGGGFGAMAGGAAAEGFMRAIAKGGAAEVEKVGSLLSSEAFKDLAVEVATKAVASPATVRKVVVSQPFKDFASSINLPRDMSAREKFLTDALTVSGQTARNADLPEAQQ